jgi:hypothetical protein
LGYDPRELWTPAVGDRFKWLAPWALADLTEHELLEVRDYMKTAPASILDGA